MDDVTIRERCEKYGIKVGPLTDSTRKLYRRKIENFENESKPTNDKKCCTVEEMTKEEISKLPSEKVIALLKSFNINLPYSSTSSSILASRLYQAIHNSTEMDWEPSSG